MNYRAECSFALFYAAMRRRMAMKSVEIGLVKAPSKIKFL